MISITLNEYIRKTYAVSIDGVDINTLKLINFSNFYMKFRGRKICRLKPVQSKCGEKLWFFSLYDKDDGCESDTRCLFDGDEIQIYLTPVTKRHTEVPQSDLIFYTNI
ncbi:unnamed protein product [Bursaphelenchus xylophilus]|uniref:(pine wood nematode) hypothetical protein n=1 Tax=Bursaphelenchus xylophilus TaxID=6326 RepID=A0A1I7SKP9_BURXY|nr:unnamed protein product [Bursaphelenchus xylophilus]CAD5224649.1 unnamed protein product [Bursaphelenchus xylophilus]CAG9081139.1 unnamed protein product [Bursaphelenchus xylophilus]CAG9113487.1 unnamed protein product [Bursaphelenchus xylophilus]